MIEEIFINWKFFFFFFGLMVFSSFSQQILVAAHQAQALPGQLPCFWRNMRRVQVEKKD